MGSEKWWTSVGRGADDADFDDLDRAARQCAEIENRAVFHGWGPAGITGIAQASPYEAESLGNDCDRSPGIVARAVDQLRCNGTEGAYVLAIGPEGYTRIVQSTERVDPERVALVGHTRRTSPRSGGDGSNRGR